MIWRNPAGSRRGLTAPDEDWNEIGFTGVVRGFERRGLTAPDEDWNPFGQQFGVQSPQRRGLTAPDEDWNLERIGVDDPDIITRRGLTAPDEDWNSPVKTAETATVPGVGG